MYIFLRTVCVPHFPNPWVFRSTRSYIIPYYKEEKHNANL